IRCFTDQEYVESGIEVVERLDHCDILLGVKEVPIEHLKANKTYFLFSHTIKKQQYNHHLLRNILKKKIRLIDYEVLTEKDGSRAVAFGRYAGIVGAYNGIWTVGNRYNLYHIKRAWECFDLEDLMTEYPKVQLPAIKIAITGGGRASKGAMEVMNGMHIRHVSPAQYLTEYFEEPVFTQLNIRDYHKHKEGKDFNRKEFYENPENYQSNFLPFAQVTDLLIAAAYWDPNSPVLFTRYDVLKNDFNIKVIADVTCDIEGSIPSTKKASTIDDPIYDYNPSEDKIELSFTDEANITVMAIDNLPCELPRDASHDFGHQLIDRVFPRLFGRDPDRVIKRATITENGSLTPPFKYLQDFVDGK
ncbi:MAG: NAD(P)-dependent oxidoreductase, partial [Bacteroidetes bacterium]|nr:NAD(P)-dependent oxidoreductase [Bacteroidota bacterium]